MNKYGFHGKLKATEGNGPKLSALLLEASRAMSAVKGCHLYMVSRDRNDADAIWVTEVWDSKDDHDNSLKLEGARELIAQAMPILDRSSMERQELDVLNWPEK